MSFIQRKITKIISKLRYDKRPFSIISNNCWGSELYGLLELPYLTPFVGLFLYAPCYIEMLKDFDNYIKSELIFTDKSRYKQETNCPVALLNGKVEVHFMHYKNEEEARSKWCRRRDRMVRSHERMFFKFDDRDNCTDELVQEFHKMPFENKISFTVKRFPEYTNNIFVDSGERLPDGLQLFRDANQYFDVVHWVNTGKVKIK